MRKSDFERYIERLAKPVYYLISIAPDDKPDWRPVDSMMTLGNLLWHLAEAFSIISVVAERDWSERFTTPQTPKSVGPAEALEILESHINPAIESVRKLSDEEYYESFVKTPWGDEDKMSVMLMNMCDHITHHKMQLFLYLKMLGFNLNTFHLYYGAEEV